MSFRRIITIPLWLSVVASTTAVSLQAPGEDSIGTNPVADLLAEANELALHRFEYAKALALYSKALVYESGNAEILWRISRSYIDIGDHIVPLTEDEEQKQLGMYEKALEFAARGVEADPANSMAYTCRAMARARVALYTGFWGAAGMMKDNRTDLQRAIALDSTNHLAHYVLGETHRKVLEKPWILRWPLGLGWGDEDRARTLFQTAVDLKWDSIHYRLASARAYLEDDRIDEARAHLSLIPLLPTQDDEDDQRRLEARELLQRLNLEE